MAQTNLTLETLGDLDDGAARAVINKELDVACHDLDDRGDDGKPRQVLILVTMQMMEGKDKAVIHVEAAAKAPKRRTGPTIGRIVRKDGQTQLAFQQFDPEDPDQRTIDEAMPKTDKE